MQQTFTPSLARGQDDEGSYHWAGQASDLDEATRMAREEMDANDERGAAIGEPTTEYDVVDYAIGVNEYAAPDMLDALQQVHRSKAAWAKLTEPERATVQRAIDRGLGRA